MLLSRIAYPEPNARLHVFGPGQARAAYECPDLMDCLTRQSQIESELVAQGYQLLAEPDQY